MSHATPEKKLTSIIHPEMRSPSVEEWERHVRSWDGRESERRWQHPANRIADGSGLLDMWYFDDGTILAIPELAVPFLEAFDKQSSFVGSERNRCKTKGLFFVA